jgi:hypothetical protein
MTNRFKFPEDAEPADAVKRAGTLANNNLLVDSLRGALSSGAHAFDGVPALLGELFEDEAWMDRRDRQGGRHQFGPGQFRDFLTAPPPRGLGVTVHEVRRFLTVGDPIRGVFEDLVAREGFAGTFDREDRFGAVEAALDAELAAWPADQRRDFARSLRAYAARLCNGLGIVTETVTVTAADLERRQGPGPRG